jgi:NAD(P)-dependent dehydrogenase (short-subunit alcohol dehydrogenase family)
VTLRGARVVVTGASRGIGQGIAVMFAGEGATVAGLDIRDGGETASLAGAGFRHFEADVSDPAAVARAFSEIDAHFGAAPDVLCCVAGIAPEVAFLETTPELFDRIIAVNVRGPFLCGQAAAARMKEAGGGRIVNISSTAAVQGWALASAYGASKGGVALLTRCMAIELARYSIAVNAVGPGTIETPLAASLLGKRDWVEHDLARTPTGRFGRPDDIAAAVRFLARDATWMTGQTIYVDGGFLATGGPMLDSLEDHRSIER